MKDTRNQFVACVNYTALYIFYCRAEIFLKYERTPSFFAFVLLGSKKKCTEKRTGTVDSVEGCRGSYFPGAKGTTAKRAWASIKLTFLGCRNRHNIINYESLFFLGGGDTYIVMKMRNRGFFR
jgi:hypothetical protein